MTAAKTELPPDVTAADTKYPAMGREVPYEDLRGLGLDFESGWAGRFTFYQTKGLEWVLTTLHISNASRRQAAGTPARTYGVGVADGKVYTVGRGPHVTAVVEVYLTKDNLPRLRQYVDLWKKGMADAGAVRDRISTRRAQGQLHRAAGRTSWMW